MYVHCTFMHSVRSNVLRYYERAGQRVAFFAARDIKGRCGSESYHRGSSRTMDTIDLSSEM